MITIHRMASRGIADGRGLAATLMLGAHGALIGTRFYATPEALGHERAKQRIVGACRVDVAVESEYAAYQAADRTGDRDIAVIWTGEGVDLIDGPERAGALVARISAVAEGKLRFGATLAR